MNKQGSKGPAMPYGSPYGFPWEEPARRITAVGEPRHGQAPKRCRYCGGRYGDESYRTGKCQNCGASL